MYYVESDERGYRPSYCQELVDKDPWEQNEQGQFGGIWSTEESETCPQQGQRRNSIEAWNAKKFPCKVEGNVKYGSKQREEIEGELHRVNEKKKGN